MKGLPPSFTVASEIRSIAGVFVEIQTRRNLADYDFTENFFTRGDVLLTIQDAENAIAEFKRLPSSAEKQFFLACLWAWNTLSTR